MTRFATFWVEGGRIVAPVTPMRFDDSIYRMLGDELVDLTRERELLPDASTYGERSDLQLAAAGRAAEGAALHAMRRSPARARTPCAARSVDEREVGLQRHARVG